MPRRRSCSLCLREFCGRGGKGVFDPFVLPCVELAECCCGLRFCFDCMGSETRAPAYLARCVSCEGFVKQLMCRKVRAARARPPRLRARTAP